MLFFLGYGACGFDGFEIGMRTVASGNPGGSKGWEVVRGVGDTGEVAGTGEGLWRGEEELVGEGEEIGVDVTCWGGVDGEEEGRKDEGGKDCGSEGEAGGVEFEVEAGKEELITVDEGEEKGAGWDAEELGVVLFNSSLGTGVSDLGSLVCCIGGQSITLHMYFFFFNSDLRQRVWLNHWSRC